MIYSIDIVFTSGNIAIGTALILPSLNTALNNTLGDSERTQAFSVLFVLSALARFPAGSIGGELYTWSPVLPFILIVILTGVGLLGHLAVVIRQRKQEGITGNLRESSEKQA